MPQRIQKEKLKGNRVLTSLLLLNSTWLGKLLPYPEIFKSGIYHCTVSSISLFGEFVRYDTRGEKDIMSPLVFYWQTLLALFFFDQKFPIIYLAQRSQNRLLINLIKLAYWKLDWMMMFQVKICSAALKALLKCEYLKKLLEETLNNSLVDFLNSSHSFAFLTLIHVFCRQFLCKKLNIIKCAGWKDGTGTAGTPGTRKLPPFY